MSTVRLGPSDGTLSVNTGVAGGAAKVGHSLVISVADWTAEVGLDGESPLSVSLVAEVSSMAVVSGSGGLRPLSGLDKEMIRSNALRSMHAKDHPQIRFATTEVRPEGDSVALRGHLSIAGRSRELSATVAVARGDDGWQVSSVVPLTQSDFGIKPYSLMFGQLRVADDVEVHLTLRIGADRI